MQFRFFPVACCSCLAMASLMGFSVGSLWTDQGFDSSPMTMEAFALSRALLQLDDWEWSVDSYNRSDRVSFSLWDLPSFDSLELSMPTEKRCPSSQHAKSFSRQHTVAFYPVIFDDMFSIDKRGNTLHYVDDKSSVARSAYDIFPSLRRLSSTVVRSMKYALPFGISIVTSS
ncbi:uncharacterized protein LOC129599356 [Paramacrobiotus metropolitanus]|uniref:uncharacterized protein LOC129599356 n=1 Tax=Paramacrobiotus metropolitanus TaxID=2943436 RepID=UPI00244652E6|nr:uncharacterized protein LOC129599356 [Paramacrobiotus metropolitanus]XP_055353551.1 uncharacterized protein LOC129599356 [Paramacrobiotus metropolitanus]